jgi:hypothetical protein
MAAGSWVAGWPVDSWVEASEFKKGVGCVFDSTLAAPAANFDCDDILSTYGTLRILFQGASSQAAASVSLNLYINGDTNANYFVQDSYASAATTTSAESLGTIGGLCGYVPGSTATPPNSAVEIVIPNYAGTVFTKAWTSTYMLGVNNTSGTLRVGRTGGYWASSIAISRGQLFPSAGNFIVGSRMSVYVMGV